MTEHEFEMKYNEYSQMIKNISYTYLNSSNDSDDVLQDVFLKYLKHYEKIKDSTYEKYWLIRVTINTCKDYLRKNKYYIEEFNEAYHTISAPSQDYRLYSFVCALKEKYKSVVILYYYENMQIIDISKALKISQSAVKMRLKRAKELLQKMEGIYDNRQRY